MTYISTNNSNKKYIQGLLLLLLLLLLPSGSLYAAEGYDQYASSSDMATQKEIERYGMVPIYGQDLEDGSYEISVDSSSPFFRIERAVLNVNDGKMDATITMSSYSYDYTYLGTAEDAAAAEMADYIHYKEVAGYYTFSFEVPYLNHRFSLAAFSNRKKKWYDRDILFDASTLEEGALKIDLPDYDKIEKAIELYDSQRESLSEASAASEDTSADSSTESASSSADSSQSGSLMVTALTPATAMEFDADDGEYSIELDMTGGSGRASISSPTLLIIKDGKAYAQLTWSSTYYDYMIVGGQKYLNENSDGGNSTFTIPISAMDQSIPVIGDTTAMDEPVEVSYELTFYSDSIGSKSMIPQEAAKRVLIVGVIIMILGGIINHFLKKRRFH